MATTNFTFTTLTGTETAGWNSINTLITSIDSKLNESTRLIATDNAFNTGYTITWNGTKWLANQITADGIANLAVTTAKIADDAVTLGTKTNGSYVATIAGTANQIASSGATSGEGIAHTLSLVSSAILPGTPTIGTPPTYTNGAAGDSKVATTKYVGDALAYATAGNITLTGDVTVNSGVATISNDAVNADKLKDSVSVDADRAVTTNHIRDNAITDAKLRTSSGLSIIGRSASSSGNIADITGIANQVLRVSGTTLGFGTITSAMIEDGTIVLADLAAALQELLVPTGSIQAYVGSTSPSGWLFCDGGAGTGAGTGTLNATSGTYLTLWNVLNNAGFTGIGTQSAMTLPDLRGRTLVGKGTNTDVNGLGKNEGIIAANLANRSPKHAHSHSLTAATTGSHSHGYYQQPGYTAAQSVGSGIPRAADNNAASGGYPTNTDSAGSHSHSVTGSVGTGSGTNDTAPFITVNYIIKY